MSFFNPKSSFIDIEATIKKQHMSGLKNRFFYLIVILGLVFQGCQKDVEDEDPTTIDASTIENLSLIHI